MHSRKASSANTSYKEYQARSCPVYLRSWQDQERRRTSLNIENLIFTDKQGKTLEPQDILKTTQRQELAS